MMRKIVSIILSLCLINIYATGFPVCAYEISQPEALQGRIVTIPAGASFTAKMQSSVSSASLKSGDNIAAVLDENWIYEGILVAPAGSIIYGNAVEVEQAGRGYKNGEFELRFNEIITPEGQSIPIASNIYTVGIDEKRPLKIAATVGKGALIGLFVGGLSGDDDSNAIIGAGLGLLTGAMAAMSKQGNDVELPRNTLVKVKLSHHIYITVYG